MDILRTTVPKRGRNDDVTFQNGMGEVKGSIPLGMAGVLEASLVIWYWLPLSVWDLLDDGGKAPAKTD
jgi:hypothetical protein